MAPAGRATENVGERVAALYASFEAEKEYQHDRWHKLDNDLTPVVNLPERLTREIGKLQGIFDGRISTVTRDFERSMESAISKALQPVTDEVSKLQSDVEILKSARSQETGIRRFGAWVLQTAISVIAAFAAVLAMGRHP